jgi:uncharacterized protein (DUF1697 family)
MRWYQFINLQIFNIRKNDVWLNFDDVRHICSDLGFITVPVISSGKHILNSIEYIAKETVAKGEEGIVVRVSRDFTNEEFETCVAKYVRENHVQTDEHWINQNIEINGLKKIS